MFVFMPLVVRVTSIEFYLFPLFVVRVIVGESGVCCRVLVASTCMTLTKSGMRINSLCVLCVTQLDLLLSSRLITIPYSSKPQQCYLYLPIPSRDPSLHPPSTSSVPSHSGESGRVPRTQKLRSHWWEPRHIKGCLFPSL